jgi:hypothetical protein
MLWTQASSPATHVRRATLARRPVHLFSPSLRFSQLLRLLSIDRRKRKKQRSHGKHGTLPTTATHSDGILSDEFEECHSPEFMELCTNLDHDAFRSLDDPQHHINTPRVDINQLDPSQRREVPPSESPPLAPLDPQYKASTDLAGAKNT